MYVKWMVCVCVRDEITDERVSTYTKRIFIFDYTKFSFVFAFIGNVGAHCGVQYALQVSFSNFIVKDIFSFPKDGFYELETWNEIVGFHCDRIH